MQAAKIRNHVVKGFNCILGRAEGGDSGSCECASCAAYLDFTHPAGEHGFLGIDCSFENGLCHSLRIDHRARCENHQHGIDLVIVETSCQCAAVAFRRRIKQHIDRVAMRPAARQATVQRADGIRRQRGDLDAEGDRQVGSHYRRPAPVADDCQAVACRSFRAGQRPCCREHVADRLHTDDAGPPQCGVKNIIVTHHCAGLRLGYRCCRQGLARLDRNHRFDACGGAYGAHEAP